MVDLQSMRSVANPQAPNIDPVVQASAASLANPINYFITRMSGTNAVTGFRFKRGFRGLFCVIPAAAMTGATGGTLAYDDDNDTEDIPIGKAFTCVANVATLFVTDGALVYPVAMTAELID